LNGATAATVPTKPADRFTAQEQSGVSSATAATVPTKSAARATALQNKINKGKWNKYLEGLSNSKQVGIASETSNNNTKIRDQGYSRLVGIFSHPYKFSKEIRTYSTHSSDWKVRGLPPDSTSDSGRSTTRQPSRAFVLH